MRERLRKAIGNHLWDWDVRQANPSSKYFVSNVVVLDVDVFRPCVENRAACQSNWTLIVSSHINRLWESFDDEAWLCERFLHFLSNNVLFQRLDPGVSLFDVDLSVLIIGLEQAQFGQEKSQPRCFFCFQSESDVLGFNLWQGHGRLSFRAPADWFFVQHEDIARGGLPALLVTSPVGWGSGLLQRWQRWCQARFQPWRTLERLVGLRQTMVWGRAVSTKERPW